MEASAKEQPITVNESIEALVKACLHVLEKKTPEVVNGVELENALVDVSEELAITLHDPPACSVSQLKTISDARILITKKRLDTRETAWTGYIYTVADMLWMVECALSLPLAYDALETSPNNETRATSFPLVFAEEFQNKDLASPIGMLSTYGVTKTVEALSWKLTEDVDPTQRNAAYFFEFLTCLTLLKHRAAFLIALKLDEDRVGPMHKAPTLSDRARDELETKDSEDEDDNDVKQHQHQKQQQKRKRKRDEQAMKLRREILARESRGELLSRAELQKKRKENKKYSTRKLLRGDDGIDVDALLKQASSLSSNSSSNNTKRQVQAESKDQQDESNGPARVETNPIFLRETRFYFTWLESDVHDALAVIENTRQPNEIDYWTTELGVRRIRKRLVRQILRRTSPYTLINYFYTFWAERRFLPCDTDIYYTRKKFEAQKNADKRTILIEKGESEFGYDAEQVETTYKNRQRDSTDCMLNYLCGIANGTVDDSIMSRMCVDWRNLSDIKPDGMEVHVARIQPLNSWRLVHIQNPNVYIEFASFTHAFAFAKLKQWIGPLITQTDDQGVMVTLPFQTLVVDPELFMRTRDVDLQGTPQEHLDPGLDPDEGEEDEDDDDVEEEDNNDDDNDNTENDEDKDTENDDDAATGIGVVRRKKETVRMGTEFEGFDIYPPQRVQIVHGVQIEDES